MYKAGTLKERTKRSIVSKVLTREFKAGDMLQSEAQTHIGANVGDTPTHVLMIEFK